MTLRIKHTQLAAPVSEDHPADSHSQGDESPMMPKFLCIGAQKSGTTTLQLLLDAHPMVFLPKIKEVHYFSLHADAGPRWYANHYTAALPRQACGDITPYYLFHPEAPGRIQALLPRIRLIVLLRDPVERALSQYFHSRRLGFEPLALDQALAAENERLAGAEAVLKAPDGRHASHQEHSYLSRSRYEHQLARYELLFPAAQLLVLRSETFFSQPDASWERLQQFLGLDALPLPNAAIQANEGHGEASRVPQNVRRRLRDDLDPTYRVMAERYGLFWSEP